MAEQVILYDLRERNYPDNRGDVFRSLQVHECGVCGALTNKVVMGGWPGYGVRTVCPQSAECWHHELQDKISWLKRPHPEAYKEELQKEIEKLKLQRVSDVHNDIVGNPDFSLHRMMTTTKGHRGYCEHWG